MGPVLHHIHVGAPRAGKVRTALHPPVLFLANTMEIALFQTPARVNEVGQAQTALHRFVLKIVSTAENVWRLTLACAINGKMCFVMVG